MRKNRRSKRSLIFFRSINSPFFIRSPSLWLQFLNKTFTGKSYSLEAELSGRCLKCTLKINPHSLKKKKCVFLLTLSFIALTAPAIRWQILGKCCLIYARRGRKDERKSLEAEDPERRHGYARVLTPACHLWVESWRMGDENQCYI